jgi:tRNA dimethylallyltransferase
MTNQRHKTDLITILGPTATGKTLFAAHIAHLLNGEIISADSRQVYKHMDLGTGKDYNDYIVNGKPIPYHLIDICDPGYKYNVFEYQNDFLKVYNEIKSRGKLPVLCGGTGMYIEAVTKNYKLIAVPKNQELRSKLENKNLEELEEILSRYKKLHNKTDTDTRKRALRAIEIEEYYKNHPDLNASFPEIKSLYIGIGMEREERRRRITERLHKRLKTGMIEEVRRLMDSGLKAEDLIYYGLEYKYITRYLTGTMSYEDMVSKLNIAIHQFAKRQMTWFRKMERKGTRIYWIDGKLPLEQKLSDAINYIENYS